MDTHTHTLHVLCYAHAALVARPCVWRGDGDVMHQVNEAEAARHVVGLQGFRWSVGCLPPTRAPHTVSAL